jgi:CRP/FNR family transcriptional regulator
MKTYRTYLAGEPIYWQGDEMLFVASVVKGVATLSKTLEDGRTQVVGLSLPSDFIGRPGRTTANFDVTAATDVTLCRFERKPFEHLVATTPHLSERLIEITMDELDAARDWMLLLGRKSASEKIATFLSRIVVRQNLDDLNGPEHELELPLTREKIANYLGLTLETVSRQITKLKKDGVLDFSNRTHFTVLDMDALHRATGEEDAY